MCAGVNRKMHFHLKKLAIVVAFAIGGRGAAYAQNAVEQLQPLVQTTAHRLMIGEQVALAKWDSGKAVEDAPREAQVILRNEGWRGEGAGRSVGIELFQGTD